MAVVQDIGLTVGLAECSAVGTVVVWDVCWHFVAGRAGGGVEMFMLTKL